TNRISDDDAGDREAIALRSKVSLAYGATPGEPTRVEVVLRDGTVSSACRDVNTPERDLGAQRRRLSEKFVALAQPALGAVGAEELLEALTDMGGEQSVGALMALARP